MRAAAAILLLGLIPGCSSPQPRNLVILVVDTLRADALGCYGSSRGATPQLDAFARESSVFDHAWAQGTYTPASFMSYMTSTHVRTHGWDYHVAFYPEAGVCSWTDVELLPEVLAKSGFRTDAVVANNRLHPKFGFARGFGSWNGVPLEGPPADDLGDTRTRWSAFYGDREAVRDAREILRGWVTGRRHFLYVHLMSPHLPLVPSAQALEALGLPRDWAPDGAMSVQQVRALDAGSSQEDRQSTRDGYRASVWDADRFVGEVLAAIDETGHADDTVVMFLADHGEQIWEHGEYGHGSGVWEQLAHVPLLVRVPGRAPQRIAGRAVALLDVAPTALALLGVAERPPSWAGRNLFEPAEGRAVFTERQEVVAVTTDGRVKAVFGPERLGVGWRYFDLRRDPTEQSPERRAAAAASLRQHYRSWAAATPRVERDTDAPPAGRCRELTPRDRDELEARLRDLGYVE